MRAIHKGYLQDSKNSHFSRYIFREITGLHWHAMGGIIMYRNPKEPTYNIMLQREKKPCYAMKDIM